MAVPIHSSRHIVCVLGLVLISALSLPMQGLSTAVLLILLGHYGHEAWLKGMGIASGLVFAAGYYYSLETTLMLKSLYLMGLGGVLIIARLLMWRFFPSRKYLLYQRSKHNG